MPAVDLEGEGQSVAQSHFNQPGTHDMAGKLSLCVCVTLRVCVCTCVRVCVCAHACPLCNIRFLFKVTVK